MVSVHPDPASAVTSTALRVLLVDDHDGDAQRSHDAVRHRLSGALNVRRVMSLGQAIRALTTDVYDVVLLELELHDATGIATLAGIRSAAPEIPVVVLARTLDDTLALRALRAGAQECLLKGETTAPMLGRAMLAAIERQQRLRSLEAERVAAAHRATHDALTGLANRELFLDHLEQALAFGARYGRKIGLLFVDLDGFKRINDVHGHARGDALLRAVAGRLVDSVRRSDAVGRLGGDEFVVLLPEITSRRDVLHVRETILACLREPIDVGGGQRVLLDASVGGAMSPLDGQSAQSLLDAADTDMYRHKDQRRRDRAPTPVLGVEAVLSAVAELSGTSTPDVPTHRREARMREAVRAGEFEVHYQPIVDTLTGRLCGAEALLRWRDPDRGLLLPQSFLALAEDTGLIVPLGEMVLRVACRAAAAWRTLPGGSASRIAVNTSAVQLRERGFARRVASILKETACPADALTLELTEHSMRVDSDTAMETLRELKARGVRLVVDDFGVGYASLTFVREAPVDGIKVDRRFVAGMLHDPRDLAIIASMIRLAHGLHLDVTAEGVESAAQAERLIGMRCFRQQGRYHGPPVTPLQMEGLMRRTGDQLSSNSSDPSRVGLEGDTLARPRRLRHNRFPG